MSHNTKFKIQHRIPSFRINHLDVANKARNHTRLTIHSDSYTFQNDLKILQNILRLNEVSAGNTAKQISSNSLIEGNILKPT